MALISANTIITSVSLFHLTIAFFLLNSPKTIEDQALVYVLGESMGMVRSSSPDTASLTSSPTLVVSTPRVQHWPLAPPPSL